VACFLVVSLARAQWSPRGADFLQFRLGIPPDDERVFDTPDSKQRPGGPERAVELAETSSRKAECYVLTDEEARKYLAACPQPWKDAATIMLGTAIGTSEVFPLRWENVLLNGSGGLLQITDGKSRAARQRLPLVPAVYDVLRGHHNAQGSPMEGWVFSADTKSGHLAGGSAKNQHALALKNSGVRRFDRIAPDTPR